MSIFATSNFVSLLYIKHTLNCWALNGFIFSHLYHVLYCVVLTFILACEYV